MAKAKRATAGELPPEVVARIRETVQRSSPGLWANEVDYGPACVCGLGREEPRTCYRHAPPEHGSGES